MKLSLRTLLVGFGFSKSGKATPPNSVCLRYREYADNEYKDYKLDVFSYMLRSMQVLLKAVKELQLEDAKLCRAVQALAVHCQSVTSLWIIRRLLKLLAVEGCYGNPRESRKH